MLDMGWKELERKLIQDGNNWFLDHENPKHWDVLCKLLKDELPEYKQAEVEKMIEHARSALLPPISKTRIVRWLQHNLPVAKSNTIDKPMKE